MKTFELKATRDGASITLALALDNHGIPSLNTWFSVLTFLKNCSGSVIETVETTNITNGIPATGAWVDELSK